MQNIKELCKQKDVKPTVACRESGVGATFINEINRGQTPSVAKVQLLANYLGVTTSELLGEELPGMPTLSPAALEVAAAYDGTAPDLQAAVRRVLGL